MYGVSILSDILAKILVQIRQFSQEFCKKPKVGIFMTLNISEWHEGIRKE